MNESKVLTQVFIAYVNWRRPPPNDDPVDQPDVPILWDSYESALHHLRGLAAKWTTDHSSKVPVIDFSKMDEQAIRETVQDELAGDPVDDEVVCEIFALDIWTRTSTGMKTLDLALRDAALAATRLPGQFQPVVTDLPHRFESGLTDNNSVVRCVVTGPNGKQYFGPWRGSKAHALEMALMLVPASEKG